MIASADCGWIGIVQRSIGARMITPVEGTIAARVLAPIMRELYSAANTQIAKRMNRWQSTRASEQVARRLLLVGTIKTIWAPEKEVSVREFLYPAKFVGPNGGTFPVGNVKDLKRRTVVIEGIVGQGKSIFSRFLCQQEIGENGSGKIPVFVELRFISNNRSLRDLLFQAIDRLRIRCDDDVFEHMCSSGRIVFILDGFDEIDESFVRNVINDLENLALKYDDLHIVVTSRPDSAIQKSNYFSVLKIAPLTPDDYPGFIENLNVSDIRSNDIRMAISRSPADIAGLVTTPLILTLLIIIYENERIIPPNVPKFFDQLFEVMFVRHDRLKAGFERKTKSGLSEYQLKELFDAFSYIIMLDEYGRSLSNNSYAAAFKDALECSPDAKCKPEDFRWDMSHVACLLVEEGRGFLTFLHKSVAEYHAASYIAKQPDEQVKDFYSLDAGENFWHWRQVVDFLSSIDRYRCTKLFLKPEAEKVLISFNARAREYGPRQKLLESFATLYPKFAVSYALDRESKRYRREDVQLRPENVLITKYIENRVNSALSATLPEFLRVEDVKGSTDFRRIENSPVVSVELGFANIVKNYDMKEFEVALEIGITDIRELRDGFDRLIDGVEGQRAFIARKRRSHKVR